MAKCQQKVIGKCRKVEGYLFWEILLSNFLMHFALLPFSHQQFAKTFFCSTEKQCGGQFIE
jgi:hypothetical protein